MLLETVPLKHGRWVHEWQAVSIQEQNLQHTAFIDPLDHLNVAGHMHTSAALRRMPVWDWFQQWQAGNVKPTASGMFQIGCHPPDQR